MLLRAVLALALVACARADYDSDLAYTMMQLSAAAYSDDPQGCLQKVLPDFTVDQTAGVKCDWANSICFAYTAVSQADRAIVYAFRGSADIEQILAEVLKTLTGPTIPMAGGGRVQSYFYHAWDLLQPKLAGSLTKLLNTYGSYEVWITGHSLGASVASIALTNLTNSRQLAGRMLRQYTFGEPRTGDAEFAANHDMNVQQSYRVVHYKDVIPHVPPCETDWSGNCVKGTPSQASPWHHSTEVFYSQCPMFQNTTIYKACNGGEDPTCADGLMLPTSICDHRFYFSVEVGEMCSSNPPCDCC